MREREGEIERERERERGRERARGGREGGDSLDSRGDSLIYRGTVHDHW